MADYIDRQKAIDAILEGRADTSLRDGNFSADFAEGWDEGLCDAANIIFHRTSADVREVKRGRWERDKFGTFICSCCGNGYKEQPTLMGRPMYEWCPVCGADMRGEDDEEGRV